MKRPREILLQKHQAANAALDSIRKQVVAEECQPAATRTSRAPLALPIRFVLKLWGELIFPARRVWAGFACVWLGIAVFHLASSDGPSRTATANAVPAGTLMALKEQQKILAELVGPAEPFEAEKPKRIAPQPRSERERFWVIG